MSASVFKQSTAGSGMIAAAMTVPAGGTYRLISVSCVFAIAPTTSENLTITLDANAGATYDVLFYSVDPSAASTTDILWQPDEEIFLEGGDAVDVAFAGTDGFGWTVQYTVKAVP